METVEVVIRIPKKYIEGSLFNGIEKIMKAVREGTVLPKGHGKLIDADALVRKGAVTEDYLRIFAPTILEADKEVEE